MFNDNSLSLKPQLSTNEKSAVHDNLLPSTVHLVGDYVAWFASCNSTADLVGDYVAWFASCNSTAHLIGDYEIHITIEFLFSYSNLYRTSN